MSRKSTKNAHLLVEGKNDQHVIWALCKMHQTPETFDVIVPGESGGLDAVLDDIPVRLKEPGLRALGVVVDADEDLARQWVRVRGRLQRAGYALQTIEQNGLNRYKQTDQPKAFIHTWLAWQQNPGMPMGQAITAQLLQHDHDLSRRFVAWLNKLFAYEN